MFILCQAEAYVNTTSNDLVLSNGAVSNSILKAAGQTLQDECSKHVSKNGRVQVGDIVVTGAGNIPCKHIIHTAGSNYDSSNPADSEKVCVKYGVHYNGEHVINFRYWKKPYKTA